MVCKSEKKQKYYNSSEALEFILNKSHGINLVNYQNQYLMTFDLLSIQETSYGFKRLESSNCTISV